MERVRRLMEGAVLRGIFPCAGLLVAVGWEVVFKESFGHKDLLSSRREDLKTDDIFDVASLTKPLVTTLCVMELVQRGVLDLMSGLGDLPLPGEIKRGLVGEKARITIKELLAHSGGLMAHYPFFEEFSAPCPKELVYKRILGLPLVSSPGALTTYSDLGFMLLEMVIQVTAQKSMESFFFEDCIGDLRLSGSFLGGLDLPEGYEERVVPTEYCQWRKRLLRGVVHDENAYVMGGHSGHAGFFSCLGDIYLIVLHVRRKIGSSKGLGIFWQAQRETGNQIRALGWDMPSPKNSSAGRYFSSESVGHLGFTGCSIWLDLKRELLVVLLSNRVHPTRENELIKGFRPIIHDAVMEELGLIGP